MSADQITAQKRPLATDLRLSRDNGVSVSHLTTLAEEVSEEDGRKGPAMEMTEGSVKRRIEEGVETSEKVRNTTQEREKHLTSRKTVFCAFFRF